MNSSVPKGCQNFGGQEVWYDGDMAIKYYKLSQALLIEKNSSECYILKG